MSAANRMSKMFQRCRNGPVSMKIINPFNQIGLLFFGKLIDSFGRIRLFIRGK